MIKTQIIQRTNRRKNLQFTINHSPLTSKAQVILEFTFCMIIVLLMMYAAAKVCFWTGRDFAERASAHDRKLIGTNDPLSQIDPYFYDRPVKMNAVYGAN